MKSLFDQWIFHKNDISVVKLIILRSDLSSQLPEKVEDFRSDPIFINLPSFPQKNIKEFYYSLQNDHKDLKKSLKVLGFNSKFDYVYIDSLVKLAESQNQIPDVFVFSFLYQCLSFLGLEKTDQTDSDYRKILKIMNFVVSSPFHIFFFEIYRELVRDILQNNNIEWDVVFLNLIIEQIVTNLSFDSSISNTVIQILSKLITLKNFVLIDSFLSILVIHFEDQRNTVMFSNYTHILSLLTEYINDLKLNALMILAYCSQRTKKEQMINDTYRILPNLIIAQLLQSNKITFNPREILPSQKKRSNINNGVKNNDEKSGNFEENEDDDDDSTFFEIPPEISDKNIHLNDICGDYLRVFIEHLNSFFSISSTDCVEIFVDSLVSNLYDKNQKVFSKTNEHSIDFILIICGILKNLSRKVPINKLIHFIINSSIFDPNISIYSSDGLNKNVSLLRNSIFDLISESDKSFFYLFLESATSHPCLLAEYIMRLSYRYDNSFFANTYILYSLMCSINMIQQQKNYLFDHSNHKAARSVILSVIVSLLDENDVSFKCFSNKDFCTSFMNMLLEKSTTEIAINIFVKCVSKFQTLPDATVEFISFILKMCTIRASEKSEFFEDSKSNCNDKYGDLHINNENSDMKNDKDINKYFSNDKNAMIKNINERCSKEINDDDNNNDNNEDNLFFRVARQLVKAMIATISHKISLGISVAPIFDNTLCFLKLCDPTTETLEMTMNICALITQSQTSIDVNSDRYNLILDIIYKIEKDEPSDLTLQSFLNQMNASTNTAIDQMFLIQTSEVIPIILASFSKSQRLLTIIQFFQELCVFSLRNITACHNGDLSLILLKALVGTPFVYKKRELAFKLTAEAEGAILKLVSTIVCCRSSTLVNNEFLNLIYPNPETGNFLPVSEKAILALHQLFTQVDRSSFQISNESPVYTVDNVEGDLLREGFAFSFMVKVDLTNIVQTSGIFVFLHISDSQKHCLEIYQQQDSLIIRYESNQFKTSTPMSIPIPSNKWICVSAFIFKEENERTIVYFKFSAHLTDDVLFKTVVFEKNVDVRIGFTRGLTIPPNEISPVSMSTFAMFLPPFDDEWFDSNSPNGFVDMTRFTNIAFSSMSPQTKFHEDASNNSCLSIISLMPLHTKITNFLGVFQKINSFIFTKNSTSSIFNELSLRSVFLFSDCLNYHKSGACFSMLPDSLSEIKNIKKITKIPMKILRSFYKTNESCFALYMNELSLFFSSILNFKNSNSNCSISPLSIRTENYVLSVALKLIETTPFKANQLELLESVVLNIWFWCTPSSTAATTTNENESDSNEQQLKQQINQNSYFNFQKNLRQLVNFFSQFSFPTTATASSNEIYLFSEFLMQTHLLCNYSNEQFPSLDTYRFRILELIPMKPKDEETLAAIIIYLSNKDDISLSTGEDYEAKKYSEITNYIDFLIHISTLKQRIYPREMLFALAEIVPKTPFYVVERLIALYKISAGNNLRQCLLNVALNLENPIDNNNDFTSKYSNEYNPNNCNNYNSNDNNNGKDINNDNFKDYKNDSNNDNNNNNFSDCESTSFSNKNVDCENNEAGKNKQKAVFDILVDICDFFDVICVITIKSQNLSYFFNFLKNHPLSDIIKATKETITTIDRELDLDVVISDNGCSLWWFWIALTIASIEANEEIIMNVVSSITVLKVNQLVKQCELFITTFAILRATNAFPRGRVTKALSVFLNGILEFTVESFGSIPKPDSFSIAILAIFALFHKLKSEEEEGHLQFSSFSKAILNIFNEVNMFPIPNLKEYLISKHMKNHQFHRKGNKDISDFRPIENNIKKNLNEEIVKINDGKFDFDFGDMNLDFLKYILTGKIHLDYCKYNFWVSHTKKFDFKNMRYIRSIIENLIATQSDNFQTIKKIHKLLLEIEKKGKIDIFLANEIFPRFVSNEGSIYNEMKSNFNSCLMEIKTLLFKELSHKFNYKETYLNRSSIELFRINQLFKIVDDFNYKNNFKDINDTIVSIPRVLRFPINLAIFSIGNNKKNINNALNANSHLKNNRNQNLNEGNEGTLYIDEFSFYCQMITVNGPHIVTLVVLPNEFQLLRVGKPIKVLPFNQVKFVTTFRSGCIEIYVSAFSSYLLSMKNTDIDIIINKRVKKGNNTFFLNTFPNLPFPVLRHCQEIDQMVIDLRANRKISMFDTILMLNFSHGRSFNDLSYFPIFPIIWEGKFGSSYHEVDTRLYASIVLQFHEKYFVTKKNQLEYRHRNSNRNIISNSIDANNSTLNNPNNDDCNVNKSNINNSNNNNNNKNISANNISNANSNNINKQINKVVKSNSNELFNECNKITVTEYLQSMPKCNCMTPHLYSCNMNLTCLEHFFLMPTSSSSSSFNDSKRREISIAEKKRRDNSLKDKERDFNIIFQKIYQNRKVIEKKPFRDHAARWVHAQFDVNISPLKPKVKFNINMNLNLMEIPANLLNILKNDNNSSTTSSSTSTSASSLNTPSNISAISSNVSAATTKSLAMNNSTAVFAQNEIEQQNMASSNLTSSLSSELIVIGKTSSITFCQFFEGNKDAFAVLTSKGTLKIYTFPNDKFEIVKIGKIKDIFLCINSTPNTANSNNTNTNTNTNTYNNTCNNNSNNNSLNNYNNNCCEDIIYFCVLRHFVVIINISKSIAYRVSNNAKLVRFTLSLPLTCICGIDDSLVSVVDRYLIQITDMEKYNSNQTDKSDNNDKNDKNDKNNESVSKENSNNNKNKETSLNNIFVSNNLVNNQPQYNKINCSVNGNNFNRIIANESDEIEMITSSMNFNIIVYQTKKKNDTKVCLRSIKIVSISDAKILAVINIEHKVSNLFVTEENGLVFCKSDGNNTIEIYNLVGRLINRSEFHSKFVLYTHCRSPKGVDFVFFIDEKSDLYIFEAIFPTKRRLLLSGLTNVAAMKVNRKKTALLFVMKTGEIAVFPISFKILFELCL